MLLVKEHQQRRLMVVAIFIVQLVKTNSEKNLSFCCQPSDILRNNNSYSAQVALGRLNFR
jgi:hypothetical protein